MTKRLSDEEIEALKHSTDPDERNSAWLIAGLREMQRKREASKKKEESDESSKKNKVDANKIILVNPKELKNEDLGQVLKKVKQNSKEKKAKDNQSQPISSSGTDSMPEGTSFKTTKLFSTESKEIILLFFKLICDIIFYL